MTALRAPFPYFGGKSAIAGEIWLALGQPKHYLEPFFGSGAVLLARPGWNPKKHIETICDADGFVANCWRAIQYAPDETAKWCDWPVNHADLIARKQALLRNRERLLENLVADEKWCDPLIAGYWIWAASCWIGPGMTSPSPIPNLADTSGGLDKLGGIPRLTYMSAGVHRGGKIPDVSNGELQLGDPYNPNIYGWFRELSERLRYVRVVCGDWTRVCGGNWQDNLGICGIYFDPPYAHDVGRDTKIYDQESADVAKVVAQWAVERGEKSTYRIVLSGYTGEHDWLGEHGWRCKHWKAKGGYANIGKGKSKDNRFREVLWLSPHCVYPQGVLL